MGGEKQIRVCFVSDDSTSLTGGARSQASLMKGLSQQGVQPFFVSHRQTVQVDNARKNGYTVAVIPARLYTNPRGRNRVRSVLMYPVKRLYNALQRQKMKAFLREHRIELVHINSLFSCMEWAAAAKACGIPYVWHIREYLGDDHGYYVRGWGRFRKYLRAANDRIAISDDIKRYWEGRLGTTCTRIYNGLEPEIYRRAAGGQWTSPAVRCALVGRVSEQKGQMVAIRAVEQLVNAGRRDIRLKIVGDRDTTDFEKMIKAYVRDKGLSEQVEILPFANDVTEALRDCDVGVMASNREAFGRVTIEYKMAGLIVVGSDAGGTRELIHDGQDGLLFRVNDSGDLADKLLWVMDHREEARRIAEAGQAQACDTFSIRSTVNNVLALYRQIV